MVLVYLSFCTEPELNRAIFQCIVTHANFTEDELIQEIKQALYHGIRLEGTNYITNLQEWNRFGYISHVDQLGRISVIASVPIRLQ